MADPQDDKKPTGDFDSFMKSDAATQVAAPATTPTPGKGDFDSFVKTQNSNASNPAAQPGAYQQTKGGKIRNVNEDAAHPFSDTTTSVLGGTGAMMQRPDETFQQFMARAIEAGKHVTQPQIDAENARNKKLALPTLGVAAAAGPAMLLGEGAAADIAAPFGRAIVQRSLAPLYPLVSNLVKGYVGAKVGGHIGKDVGNWVGHPELGEQIGSFGGGLYGGMGGKFPSKAAFADWLLTKGAAGGAEGAVEGAAEGGASGGIPKGSPTPFGNEPPTSLGTPAPRAPKPPYFNPGGEAEIAGPKAAAAPKAVAEVPEVASPKPTGTKSRIDTIVNEATGVKPLKPNVPLGEQLEIGGPKPTGEPITDLKVKYPDPAVRQMVRANGEGIVKAIGDDPKTMKAVHDLTRVDLRQALINAGEDMGQTTISDSKFAGAGSISRESAFDRLLAKGLKPQQILDLAKKAQ
jgi:hypothetical protein